MAEVKWIKIYTDIFDNRKIEQIEKMPEGDSIIVIWIKLLCLAGECNNSGMVYLTKEIAYTDEMLAVAFDRPLATVKLALNVFERFGMVEIIENIIYISNWEKYQNIDGMEKIRLQNRLRKSKQREKEKLELKTNMSRDSHADVTHGHATDIDIDNKYINNNIFIPAEEKKSKKSTTFVIPTLDEIRKYASEKGYKNFNAENFFYFYDSKGWKVGKSVMKSWKSCLAGWLSREKKTGGAVPDWYKDYEESLKNGEPTKPLSQEESKELEEMAKNLFD